MLGEALCFWVITKHPSDFPRHYAMRRQYVERGRIINRIPRYPNDDPVIVESWL
jgi:hypothetical protein